MERLLSVNLVLTARTVVVVPDFVLCVLDACAPAVTLVVKAFSVWCIARVNSSLRNEHVCLHNVILWTIVSTNLVGITVVITIGVPVISVSVLAWSTNQVEGSDATTVRLAEVDIILNGATKQVGSIVLARVHVGCL